VPGVGAFDAAMKNLRRKGLVSFLQTWVTEDRPYFGICLGLQLLFESSEESPGARGLGVLPGRVRKFRPSSSALKVPHMGWNTVTSRRGHQGPSTQALPGSFYFVHSFYADPSDRSLVWTTTPYGRSFCSGVARGNLLATQFHPEKSGERGLGLLKDVLRRSAPGVRS
jgi:imidazole glycerol phosphate synthase glutamine amidotransferase subunit